MKITRKWLAHKFDVAFVVMIMVFCWVLIFKLPPIVMIVVSALTALCGAGCEICRVSKPIGCSNVKRSPEAT